MRRRWAVIALAPLGLLASRSASADARTDPFLTGEPPRVFVDYCADRGHAHELRCFARHLVPKWYADSLATGNPPPPTDAGIDGGAPATCDGNLPPTFSNSPSGLGPPDYVKAYDIPDSPTGAGKIVAIVDACADTTVVTDLAAYRAHYNLGTLAECGGQDGVAPTPGGAPCFGVVSQTGDANLPPSDSGWAGEIALDVEMVSAACPQCSILLVEAATPNSWDVSPAVDEAVALGAVAVSNSYGSWEDPDDPLGPSYSDGAYVASYTHPGVLVAAASGDQAYLDQAYASLNNGVPPDAPNFPASIPGVLCVGGTTVSPDATSPRGFSEVAWGATGSGCSTEFATPSYQQGLDMGSCKMRGSVDVSAAADYSSGSIASYVNSSWEPVTGTSAATPFVTALFTRLGLESQANGYFYAHGSEFYDVTSGNNDPSHVCSDVMCNAGPGWDGPTGWGTPNGAALAGLDGGSEAGDAGSDGGGVDAGGADGGAVMDGGTDATISDASTGEDGGSSEPAPSPSSSCGCTAAGRASPSGPGGIALVAIGAVVARSRRRRVTRQARRRR